MPKVVDLIGTRFGKLVVLERLSSSRGGSVEVEYIGEAKEGTEAGVILASFNAG